MLASFVSSLSADQLSTLRIKPVTILPLEYWKGLKIGMDPSTGQIACITGVRTSYRTINTLAGDRSISCATSSKWFECPPTYPMAVSSMQKLDDDTGDLMSLQLTCASLDMSRFSSYEKHVVLDEDEYVTGMSLRACQWIDEIKTVTTNKRTASVNCGMQGQSHERNLEIPNSPTSQSAMLGFFGTTNRDLQVGSRSFAPGQTSEVWNPGSTIVSLGLSYYPIALSVEGGFIPQTSNQFKVIKVPKIAFDNSEDNFNMMSDFYMPNRAGFFRITSVSTQCVYLDDQSFTSWFEFEYSNGQTFSRGTKVSIKNALVTKTKIAPDEVIKTIGLRIPMHPTKSKRPTKRNQSRRIKKRGQRSRKLLESDDSLDAMIDLVHAQLENVALAESDSQSPAASFTQLSGESTDSKSSAAANEASKKLAIDEASKVQSAFAATRATQASASSKATASGKTSGSRKASGSGKASGSRKATASGKGAASRKGAASQKAGALQKAIASWKSGKFSKASASWKKGALQKGIAAWKSGKFSKSKIASWKKRLLAKKRALSKAQWQDSGIIQGILIFKSSSLIMQRLDILQVPVGQSPISSLQGHPGPSIAARKIAQFPLRVATPTSGLWV